MFHLANEFTSAYNQAVSMGYNVSLIDSDGGITEMISAEMAIDFINDDEFSALLFTHSELPRFSIKFVTDCDGSEVHDYTCSDDKDHPINTIFAKFLGIDDADFE